MEPSLKPEKYEIKENCKGKLLSLNYILMLKMDEETKNIGNVLSLREEGKECLIWNKLVTCLLLTRGNVYPEFSTQTILIEIE